MPSYIALIRGINVVGKNVLPMRELVEELHSLNLRNIKTYIQSGNVVFQAPKNSSAKLGERISDRIALRRGFRPHVLVLIARHLEDAILLNPFPKAIAKPNTLHLFFLASAPQTPNLAALKAAKSGSEQFKLIDRVFYLHAPEGIGRSKLAASAEKHLGVAATARNWRTVTKLQAMLEDS